MVGPGALGTLSAAKRYRLRCIRPLVEALQRADEEDVPQVGGWRWQLACSHTYSATAVCIG